MFETLRLVSPTKLYGEEVCRETIRVQNTKQSKTVNLFYTEHLANQKLMTFSIWKHLSPTSRPFHCIKSVKSDLNSICHFRVVHLRVSVLPTSLTTD